jgi:predicted ester cyclase
MKIEEAENIGRLWFEAMWSIPNLNLAEDIVDPDYDPDWILIDKTGAAQVRHEITYFRSVFPDLIYKIVEIKGENDKVWVRYRAKGTHKGEIWGFKPTNKIVEFEGVTILYFNAKEKIIDHWAAFCFYDILEELGIVPPLWELHKRLSKFKG